MYEGGRRMAIRLLPLLLTFLLGLGIAYLVHTNRTATTRVLVGQVDQPLVIRSVPDSEIPESLNRLHMKRAGVSLRAVFDVNGKVEQIVPDHQLLYTLDDAAYSKDSLPLSAERLAPRISLLQEELLGILTEQVEGIQFNPRIGASGPESSEVLITGEFSRPDEEFPGTKGCNKIVLTLRLTSGEVLWQDNTEKHRAEGCRTF
jgi:hypothetical protein